MFRSRSLRPTLDISDISAVMTVEVDRRLAARQSRMALRKAIALCRKPQTPFVTRAEIGSPAETIVRVAREVGADQIVMGTRGPRGPRQSLPRLGRHAGGQACRDPSDLGEMTTAEPA